MKAAAKRPSELHGFLELPSPKSWLSAVSRLISAALDAQIYAEAHGVHPGAATERPSVDDALEAILLLARSLQVSVEALSEPDGHLQPSPPGKGQRDIVLAMVNIANGGRRDTSSGHAALRLYVREVGGHIDQALSIAKDGVELVGMKADPLRASRLLHASIVRELPRRYGLAFGKVSLTWMETRLAAWQTDTGPYKTDHLARDLAVEAYRCDRSALKAPFDVLSGITSKVAVALGRKIAKARTQKGTSSLD